MPPLYDPEQVRPMWEELAAVGIRPLKTPAEVDAVMTKTPGTVLCVVNSVCGCAAGNARPGVMLSLQNEIIPDELVTVFAGMDGEATAQAREYMKDIAPSSPCIALFKGGQPVRVLERRHIERMTALDIANALQEEYRKHCSRTGPSISAEEFEKISPVQICGSSVSPYNG